MEADITHRSAADPVTRLMALECLKKEIDALHRAAKADAEDYLSENEQRGVRSLCSPVFADAGEYKRGKTRPKEVVDYGVRDRYELAAWMRRNRLAVESYAMAHAEDFAKWSVEETGELPGGTTRDARTEPPRPTPPKLYGFDAQAVKERLAELAGGNVLAGANALLLEGGGE